MGWPRLTFASDGSSARSHGAAGVLNRNREGYVILSVGWPDLYLWGAALDEVRAVAAGPRAAGVAPPVDGAQRERSSNHFGAGNVLFSEAK